jgi:heat shock protein HslJ
MMSDIRDDPGRLKMAKVPARIGLTLAVLMASACTTTPSASPPAPGAATLAGTRWRLEQLQTSKGDPAGIVRPGLDAVYEMDFTLGGALAMKLDCNRASGSWSARPTAPGRGTLTMSAGAMTRAMCPPGSLDTRIARDTEYVRSYVMDGNRLTLALEANGGYYTWRRISPLG